MTIDRQREGSEFPKPRNLREKLKGKKRYILLVAAVCSAVGAYASGEQSLGEALITILTAVGLS